MGTWIVVVITLFFSAMFSGLEIAFNSTNRLQLEVDLKKNRFSAKIIRLFFQNQSRFITSLLIGNNIANVIYGIAIAILLRPFVLWMLPAALEVEFVILLLQSVFSTLIVLVLAEFLPKVLFRLNPNGILSFFALPTFVLYCLLYPLTLLYSGIANLIIRIVFGMKVDQQQYRISTVDFDDYITEYADPDEADEDVQQEIQLFQNAMEFRSVKLRECMGPRNEIESVKLTDDLYFVKDRFEETKHSKLIVYSDSIDNIVGYIHLNDVVNAIAHHHDNTISDLVRPIDFFPETYTADRLLRHFIQKHQGVAVVVDEFGGTSGIVTMEDVMEEIFGEIEDEYDEEEETEKVVKDDTYVFSARLEIDYLNETYKLDLPVSDDYETLAGMVLHYYENIPETGEELTIGHYRIKVLKATDMKLEELELKRVE
ncbi:MAG: HlyC/CorC family transporter [Bacteroidales bacterium]|jgi:CBS domain containing-hemolysin-like protein|nr:HlyC/CorC family transporter [Bacteroidales bacterium]